MRAGHDRAKEHCMRQKHSEETKAEAHRLCETTAMTYAAIGAALGGVPGPTVGSWARRHGWTRPPTAVRRKPIPKEKREEAALLRRAGVPHEEVALWLECHPETARRLGRELPAVGPPLADAAPELLADLKEAARNGVGRGECFGLTGRALMLVAFDLLSNRDLAPDRRARGVAFVAASLRVLPDEGPAGGVFLHDRPPGPATFDEANFLLEDLARRLSAFGGGGEADGVPGEPSGSDAGAP
jgi:transposase-like protein